jgi:3-oxoacyl-[acyl-carrier-protein] synthase-3
VAEIRAISYHLPERISTSAELAAEYPDWSVAKIEEKTGIKERHTAAPGECASDLAYAAAMKLFASGACAPGDIDFILLCTQSPDYFLPTTASLLQHSLGIPQTTGALDFNLGCSGYIYGLGLAQGLIDSRQATLVLLLTADTYSKYVDPSDRSTRTIFGDGASATLVTAGSGIGPIVYGTDGGGADNLIVRGGGHRDPEAKPVIRMNGPEVFTFTQRVVPSVVEQLAARARIGLDAVDLFVMHQANRFMLNHLRRVLKIPEERFFVHLETCGNTVSSSIPIALTHAAESRAVRPGSTVMLVGFGVGYSWGATLIRWPEAFINAI